MPNDIKGFSGAYRFLSNFWPVEIEYEGIVYPTTEHAYQASKTLDVDQRKIISEISSPSYAKKYGGEIKIREDWDAVKDQVMLDVLRLKFQRDDLKNMLVITGDAHLEETNTWGDTYWGVSKGVGQNRLGKLLMQVRSEVTPPAPMTIEPGCLVRTGHDVWWRVVEVQSPEKDEYGRTIIRVASLSGHSTDYWEPQHITGVKPYDGITLQWDGEKVST